MKPLRLVLPLLFSVALAAGLRAQIAVTINGGQAPGAYVLKNPTAAQFGDANKFPRWDQPQTWTAAQTFNGATVFGGTVSFGSGALTFAANQVSWASVSKSGSSLADLATRSASDLSSGTLPEGRLPALTGDATSSAGSSALTLATVNSNVGTFGSATAAPVITFDGKGRATAAGNATITPAFASITGKPTTAAGYGIASGAALDSFGSAQSGVAQNVSTSASPTVAGLKPYAASGLWAFGDSLTVGVGASDVATTAYAPVFAAAMGWTATNYAINGDQAADQAAPIYGRTVIPSSISTVQLGTNDFRFYQADANKQDVFRSALLAELAWLSIPSADKIIGTNTTAISYAGSWSNTAVYGIGKVSTTNGSTATVTVYGKHVLLGTIWQDGATGSFTVTIDGVNQGTFSSASPASIATLNGVSWAPRLLVFPHLAETAHTVIVAVTSATGGGKSVYLDWVAGVDNRPLGPLVFVGNIPRFTSAGYIASGGSEALVSTYNGLIQANASYLASMGLNVVMANNAATFDPLTGLSGDGVHPNDAGYASMAAAFQAAAQALARPSDKQAAQMPVANLQWSPERVGVSTWSGAVKAERVYIDSNGLHAVGPITAGDSPLSFYTTNGGGPASAAAGSFRGGSGTMAAMQYTDGSDFFYNLCIWNGTKYIAVAAFGVTGADGAPGAEAGDFVLYTKPSSGLYEARMKVDRNGIVEYADNAAAAAAGLAAGTVYRTGDVLKIVH